MLLIEEGRTYCITTVCQKVTPTVLSIFFVEVANTEMKFSIQLYCSDLGTISLFLTVMLLALKKIAIICSFHFFSSQR